MSLLKIPEQKVPLVKIETEKKVSLYIKRDDLIHPQISGNKFWKLFYNVNNYLEKKFDTSYIRKKTNRSQNERPIKLIF